MLEGGARFPRILIVSALAVALVAACSSAPEEEAPEPEVPEPAVTEPVVTEPAGDPELVWRVEYENRLAGVALSPDGTTVAVAERATYLHRLADGELVDAVVYYNAPGDLDYSADGSLLAAGLAVHGVAMTTADGEPIPALAGLKRFDGFAGAHLGDGNDSAVSFAPDGEHVATGNRDGMVWRWRVADGAQVGTLAAPGATGGPGVQLTVVGLDHHPSGSLLAAVHFDCTVNVWDLASSTITHEFTLETGDGSCGQAGGTFRFSPDGEHMAGMVREERDQVIRFWRVDDGTQVKDLEVLERVRAIDFSPDGSMLVVASRLGTTIWDVELGELKYTFAEEFDATATQQPLDAAFTPDGGHVVVARQDGALELWRLPGATELVAPPVDIRQPPPIPGDVLFDTNSAALKPAADAVLAELATDLLAALPSATITFIGHTDSRGAPAANQQLSLDRATSVRDWFATWAAAEGVTGWTLAVEGRGAEELKVPDVDADGAFLDQAGALNRRVEMLVAAG